MNKKIIFVPGWHNEGINMLSNEHKFWFPWLYEELKKLNLEVIAKDYPDAYVCRAQYWLPFLKELGADSNTILVGHSTGAIASMKFAEDNKLLGSILIGSYFTDLGDPDEHASGYFDTPWQIEKIKSNQNWIVQFHSTDDPWISTEEAHMVHENLNTDLHEFDDRGHFGVDRPYEQFPELLEVIKEKLEL